MTDHAFGPSLLDQGYGPEDIAEAAIAAYEGFGLDDANESAAVAYEHDFESETAMTTSAPIPTTATNNLPATTNGDSHPALIDYENDPWKEVGDGDVTGDTTSRLPYLALNRKIDGGFADPASGEIVDALDFVWLMRGRSRAQYNEPFGKGNKVPDCRSFDGITPDPRSADLKAERCADCSYSRWTDDTPPACGESVEAMVFVRDADQGGGHLARVRFGGMAVAPARAYWDSFATRMPKRPPISFMSRVELEPVETDNGKFLKPKFSRLFPLDLDAARPLIEERDRRMADWKADIEDSVATQAAPATAPATAPTAEAYYTDPDEEPF